MSVESFRCSVHIYPLNLDQQTIEIYINPTNPDVCS